MHARAIFTSLRFSFSIWSSHVCVLQRSPCKTRTPFSANNARSFVWWGWSPYSIDFVNAQCWLFRFGCETTMIFFVYVVIPVFMKFVSMLAYNVWIKLHMQETEDLKQHLQISKQRKLTLLAEVQYVFLFIRICCPSMSIEFSSIDYCFCNPDFCIEDWSILPKIQCKLPTQRNLFILV